MGTITLENVRATSDITTRVRLKDGGLAIDWSGMSEIKAWIFSDAQKALAGRCAVTVDQEDGTLLLCEYAATKPQYLGVNRIVVQCRYNGRLKTYDKPAFNLVARTAELAGDQIVLDDPVVDVSIEVQDVSSSILDTILASCIKATEEAWKIVDTHRGPAGVTEAEVSVDGTSSDEPTCDVSVEHGLLSLDFHGIKGKKGDPGAAAGIGIIQVSVDNHTGTPSATAQASGPDTAKTLSFAFHNLRGLQGPPGVANAKYKQVETLPTASADTMDFIYLTPSETSGVYNMSYTEQDENTFTWKPLGTTQIQMSDYAPKTQVDQLEAEMDVIDEKTQYLNAEEEDALFISDSNNNIIARIDKDGIKTTAVKTKQTDPSFYKGKIFIADANGNVIFCVDADGIKTTKIHADNVLINDWLGKKVATYGDSVTAVNNGNFQPPYPITQNNWGNRVADYYKFGKQYGRGIGSTCFMWRGTSGGQVAWCKTATGEYVDRNDSYNYDNYEGNVTIPSGCTAVRGDGCSWLRIVTMFPASIKSTIDAVLVMFHNDYHQDMDTAVEWVENSQTDPEWAASDEYETLGGDYNIGTVQGGIASVVMKLQAWMPQARIILMTPISGVYATDDGLDGNFDNTQSALMRKLASVVADIASRMSVPLIDNYGRDGINSLNRTSYIYDKIHPYTANGSKALAASVIGQMKTILPAL